MVIYIPHTPRKHCGVCDEDKHLWAFYNDASKPDGKGAQCKVCKLRCVERYRAVHQDEISEKQRIYYGTHREQEKDRVRAYQAEHRNLVFDHYGRACACCGAIDDLTIDHIAGNGAAHRLELFWLVPLAGKERLSRGVSNAMPTVQHQQVHRGAVQAGPPGETSSPGEAGKAVERKRNGW